MFPPLMQSYRFTAAGQFSTMVNGLASDSIDREVFLSFPLKPLPEFPGCDLDGHGPIEPGVSRLVHLAHSARADGRQDFVRTQFVASRECHEIGSDYTLELECRTMKLAERMSRLGTESAFDVLARARALEAQGRSVIHLEIGEPDFPTPPHVVEAAKKALDEGWTHYGPTQGLPELREAIAGHVSRTRGIQVGPQHVSVVPGGKPIIFFPMLALLEPGDEAIYPDPGFPIFESMIRFCGATPVPMPLEESRGFSFDLNRFEHLLTSRTKMLVLNSPQNPTGGVIPRQDLAAIAALVRDRDMVVLSDEIYSQIYYGEPPASIAQFPGMLEKTIILDGFSKTYAMTGWRMGYGVMPEWLVDAVNKLMVNSNSCTASFTQRAGIAALTGRAIAWTPWWRNSAAAATRLWPGSTRFPDSVARCRAAPSMHSPT